jgi:hypothetical protein
VFPIVSLPSSSRISFLWKDTLKEVIKTSPKTSYGKNDLQLFIEEIYSAFIDRIIEEMQSNNG